MTARYTLIETCCGSLGLSLSLLGAPARLVPYQGSKWRFRREIQGILGEAGFGGPPRQLTLYDTSTWGVAARVVIQHKARAALIQRLEGLNRLDAHAVFKSFHTHPVPEDPIEQTAQFLFLQRLSYSGKAVGVRDGRWASPGFNTSSAYGLPATDRFGPVKPLIPSLIETLRGYASLVVPERLTSVRGPAPHPTARCAEPTVVYIDPPYAGSTRYPDGDLDRAAVIALARAWFDAGAAVMISESEAIDVLLGEGWSARKIFGGTSATSPFRGKQEEWVTLSPGWSAVAPATPSKTKRRASAPAA